MAHTIYTRKNITRVNQQALNSTVNMHEQDHWIDWNAVATVLSKCVESTGDCQRCTMAIVLRLYTYIQQSSSRMLTSLLGPIVQTTLLADMNSVAISRHLFYLFRPV